MKKTYQSWPDLNQSFNKLKSEIMNAKEARTLTEQMKRPLSDVMNTIEVMAKSGNDYAAFDPKTLDNPIEMIDKLEELGFTVSVTDNNFKITW